MSIYSQIRAALELKLSEITSVPFIQYENTPYNPTTGEPFLTCQLLPTSRNPAVVGYNPPQRYQGIFTVLVYTPENKGPKANQDLCDLIIQDFDATTDLLFGGVFTRIQRAEQRVSNKNSPWFITPIDISWYAYE